MEDYMVEGLNRIIGLLNTIDKTVEDTDLGIPDRFQLVYVSTQLIKSAVQELAYNIQADDEEGFYSKSKIGFHDKEDK